MTDLKRSVSPPKSPEAQTWVGGAELTPQGCWPCTPRGHQPHTRTQTHTNTRVRAHLGPCVHTDWKVAGTQGVRWGSPAPVPPAPPKAAQAPSGASNFPVQHGHLL